MGTAVAPEVAQAPALAPQARSLEDRIKELAGWAALAYGLGFLCILVHTARYGIQVIEVIKPLNLWVGFLPALIFFFAMLAWEKKLRDLTQKAQAGRSDLVNRAAPPVASILSYLAAVLVRMLQRLRLKIQYQIEQGGAEKWAKILLNLFVVSIALIASFSAGSQKALPSGVLRRVGYLALVVVGALAVLILFVYVTDWLGRVFEKYGKLRFAFLFLLALGFIIYYIGFVYPYIPQEIGGGSPAKVQLVVEAEAFQDSPLEREGLIVRQGQAKTAITRETCLLYRAADVYILDFSCSLLSPKTERKVVSVPDRHVRAVLWQGRPDYQHVP